MECAPKLIFNSSPNVNVLVRAEKNNQLVVCRLDLVPGKELHDVIFHFLMLRSLTGLPERYLSRLVFVITMQSEEELRDEFQRKWDEVVMMSRAVLVQNPMRN